MKMQKSSKLLLSLLLRKGPENFIAGCIFIYTILLTICLTGVSGAAMGVADASGDRPICLYLMSDKVKSPENPSDGDQLLGDGTVLCEAPSDYCFSFWQLQPPRNGSAGTGGGDDLLSSDNPGFTWLARGCFKNVHGCHQDSCVANNKQVANTFFCCCKGDRCNEKIGFVEETPVSTIPPDSGAEGTPLDPLSKTLYIILAGLSILLFACASVVVYKFRRNQKSVSSTSIGLNKSPTSPCIDLNNLKFLELLGGGRYGTVYRAYLRDEVVAVKLFSHHHKLSFSNEKYIYSLPLMEHPNLLSYFGGGEVTGPDNNPYLGLVLSYCARGRLSSFLQENTLDWTSFCRIIITAVRGLGHLHSDVRRADLIKPCVSHRDFNTRNILLKEDMSCVVSDLGFAIHTQGAKFYQNGEEQIAEIASLTDVGTLRYMAPEVLEGAVNLRDCETSLKQIDIYALGLVLWEVGFRCHDLYQGTQTPNYALPFEAEIGLRPSFEQMQVLVARNKARPLFPQIWKDSSPAIKQLKETIKDCWDNDAEARLSAMCVERRLIELPNLWSRYKASLGISSISPTANPPSGTFINSSADVKSFLISNELSLPKDRDARNNRESSVSESTVETTVPFSPSDPSGRVLGKNHLMEAVKVFPAPLIQPHQGRNPCLERNTICDNSKELHISGNDLIETSEKFPYSNLELGLNRASLLEALETQQGLDPVLMNEHLVPLLNSFLPPQPQVPPPPQAIPFPSPQVPPIPYVQNEMRSGGEGRPKRHNVAKEVESRSGWRRFWRSAWEDRLVPLLPSRRLRRPHDQGEEEEERGILVTPTSSTFSEPRTPVTPIGPEANGYHQTQVLLANGVPYIVVSNRENPSSNTLYPQPNGFHHHHNNNNNNFLHNHHPPPPSNSLPPPPSNPAPPPTTCPARLAETEIGIAKLHFQPGLSPIVRSRPGSKDSGINKSSENSNSFLDSDSSLDKLKRPTTLLIQGGSRSSSSSSSACRRSLSVVLTSSDDDLGGEGDRGGSRLKLRKAKQRVKTPRRPVQPRFSLYDDSIMSGGDEVRGDLDEALSRSLPLDMNTAGSQRQSSPLPPGSPVSSLGRKDAASRLLRQSESLSGGESTSENSLFKCAPGNISATIQQRA